MRLETPVISSLVNRISFAALSLHHHASYIQKYNNIKYLDRMIRQLLKIVPIVELKYTNDCSLYINIFYVQR